MIARSKRMGALALIATIFVGACSSGSATPSPSEAPSVRAQHRSERRWFERAVGSGIDGR